MGITFNKVLSKIQRSFLLSLQSNFLSLIHLSLAFQKAPLLYKYPDCNPKTARNIALQLMSNQKFYIKVCHLMNLLALDPPFEEDYLSLEVFNANAQSKEKLENQIRENWSKTKLQIQQATIVGQTEHQSQIDRPISDSEIDSSSHKYMERISFVKNGVTKLSQLINSIKLYFKDSSKFIDKEFATIAELQQIQISSSELLDELVNAISEKESKISQLMRSEISMTQPAYSISEISKMNQLTQVRDQQKPLRNQCAHANTQYQQEFTVEDPTKIRNQNLLQTKDSKSMILKAQQDQIPTFGLEKLNQRQVFQNDMIDGSNLKKVQSLTPATHYITTQYKAYDDVDEYLKDLQSEVINNEKAIKELQEVDYDIWFSRKSGQQDGRINFQQAKRDQQVTTSLYVKNIDKKVERKDFINLLLPFFEDNQARLDAESEVVIMQKGKMRGQGFMNFKHIDKAVEIFDALNGIVIGQKPIRLEFSASKRFNPSGKTSANNQKATKENVENLESQNNQVTSNSQMDMRN